MKDTNIQWTDHTWNPSRGCSRVSEGCRNCYAEHVAARFSGEGQPYHGLARWSDDRQPKWTGKVVLVPEALGLPLRWTKPARIFVNSMSDLFHEALPEEDIAAVLGVMALAVHHTFQVLTKRPERMRDLLRRLTLTDCFDAAMARGVNLPSPAAQRAMRLALPPGSPHAAGSDAPLWPLPHVHLGVSVEDQASADARIPELLAIDNVVRFVSYEPAISSVDFRRWLDPFHDVDPMLRPTPRLAWIIVGGESGANARPFDVRWAAETIVACKAAGVACFVKQLGARPYASPEQEGQTGYELSLKSAKGGDIDEWPPELRVREFPGPYVTGVGGGA